MTEYTNTLVSYYSKKDYTPEQIQFTDKFFDGLVQYPKHTLISKYVVAGVINRHNFFPTVAQLNAIFDIAKKNDSLFPKAPEVRNKNYCLMCRNSGYIHFYRRGDGSVMNWRDYKELLAKFLNPDNHEVTTPVDCYESCCLCDCDVGRSKNNGKYATVHDVFPSGYNPEWSWFRNALEYTPTEEDKKKVASFAGWSHIDGGNWDALVGG